MKKSVVQILSAFVAFGLFACSDSTQAGGGIWDETQNTLAVHIVTASGNPAVSARVRLVTGTAVVEDSAVSDDEGIARLKRPSSDGFIEVQEQLGVARGRVFMGDSLLRDTLQKPATLQGVLTANESPQKLYLLGTSYSADVSASGNFSFENLPAGEYAILSASDSEYVYWGASQVKANGDNAVTLAAPAQDSALVDDFEKKDGTNLFHALTGSSWWFTAADSLSEVVPSLPLKALVRSDESFQGSQSLHFIFNVDSSAGAFALCGFDIGVSQWQDSTTSYDLSELDSLSFYIRGQGHIIVQFAGFDETGAVADWDFEFDIPSKTEWIRIAIPPRGNEDWEAIKSRMRTITFLSTSNAEIWLDQIVFYGVSVQKLFADKFRNEK
ncbi:MAG: Ig-like domain-containing protein [Hallerella porci]|uniref:Carboxypeptidase regulatory-like domain-containing protein n=1 Tax=Hallerella porci TaxID=1945871 RepID=A0ABX5LNM8_9BACT|nr:MULTISPECIES: Ig-like domain-containing protein [Hallerella]MCI5600843.1 Ig-like domain-containing protein [Hallerella sp.]MDY3921195.1 Ig-like domain-containing protein [Hallerella porci]PWL04045.1 hypothetical protein B0H50_10156 [Hallerella porci]